MPTFFPTAQPTPEATPSLPVPSSDNAEALVRVLVSWLRLVVEAIGATIIVIGVMVGVVLFVRSVFTRQTQDFNRIRLTLARYLALALEFQLGADLLSTAIAPTPDAIGRLAAIAVIRTGLNFFLGREMQEERTGTGPDAAAHDLAKADNGNAVDNGNAKARAPL